MSSQRELASVTALRDLTTSGGVQVIGLSPVNASHAVTVQAFLKLGDGVNNLDGTGGDFEFIGVIDGVDQPIETIPLDAAQVQHVQTTFPVIVPPGKDFAIRVKSPNADSSVSVEAIVYDVGPLQPTTIGQFWTAPSAGTGANAVNITVDDGANPLENATVRLTEGAQTFVQTTDINGDVSFSLDNGTYTVTITKAGYSFTPAQLVVATNPTNQTYSMTLDVGVPASPDQVTGVYTVYDELGIVEPNVDVKLALIAAPTTLGLALDTQERIETSDGAGLVQFTGLFKGARYEVGRSASRKQKVTIPSTAVSPYDLTSIIGEE